MLTKLSLPGGNRSLHLLIVSDTELPKHAPYLVIGAGTAAYAAYRAIRAADATAKVCYMVDHSSCWTILPFFLLSWDNDISLLWSHHY